MGFASICHSGTKPRLWKNWVTQTREQVSIAGTSTKHDFNGSLWRTHQQSGKYNIYSVIYAQLQYITMY